MGMWTRMVDLCKGKANKVIEAAEASDPVAVMKSNLNEAKEELSQVEHAIKIATGNKIKLDREVKALEKELESWGRKLNIAKETDDEALTRNVAGSLIEVKNKLRAKTDLRVRMEETYNRNRRLFEEKRSLIESYESKIKDAETAFEMSSAMKELDTSVSSGAGTSKLDKIDSMINVVDDSVNYMEGAADLAETETVKTDKKLKQLEKDAEIDKLLNG